MLETIQTNENKSRCISKLVLHMRLTTHKPILLHSLRQHLHTLITPARCPPACLCNLPVPICYPRQCPTSAVRVPPPLHSLLLLLLLLLRRRISILRRNDPGPTCLDIDRRIRMPVLVGGTNLTRVAGISLLGEFGAEPSSLGPRRRRHWLGFRWWRP
uniref:Uncharacterized protein n=1 Tax=Opuntia streptacantha TaxID=393608 RepID=A0A7C9AKV7_OPUST